MTSEEAEARVILWRAAFLLLRHNTKEKKWREENDVPEDCSCLTREAVQLAGMHPRLSMYGITPEMINDEMKRQEGG